jgi:hypothetical protein
MYDCDGGGGGWWVVVSDDDHVGMFVTDYGGGR